MSFMDDLKRWAKGEDDDDEIDDTIFDEEEVFAGFDDEYGDVDDFDFGDED